MSRIQLRRGEAADWTSADPTLAEGEPGFETDTGKFKIGDGSTAWTSLGYAAGDLAAHLADTTDAHDASAISYSPTGSISSTDVQAAIAEVAAEAGSGSTPTGTGFRHVTSGTEDGASKLVEIADVHASLKPSGSAASTDESLRRLGTGSTHAAAGDDSRFPSAGEKNALAGTSGTPGSGNKYVTDGDARNTNARTPSAHKTSHEDGGSDEISIAGLAGTSVELAAHLADTSDAHDASAISFTPAGTIAATDVQAAIEEVATEAGGGGAPTTADYLVGTAQGGLSAEIVVGTTPGGELGGTWGSPTVDATHSGSSHAAVQAAAEATAAAALSAHTGDTTDAHDASAISVDSATLVGTGTDVQAVLEELDNGIADHLADTTDAHDASAISIADAGSYFTGTDVEAALQEVAADVGGSFAIETPAGTVNGVNAAFTLSVTPNPSADLIVWKNGLVMKQGTDYTLSGVTVTFDATQIPPTGAILLAAVPRPGNVGNTDGWVDDTLETWTYASADAPTFTFTVSGDKTAKYTAGKRLKLTQTTAKYFIVTASSFSGGTTTVTIYGGTDYTLANAAISANYHSAAKAPDGFPLDPAKWTVETTFTNSPAKASPTATTWYGDTGLSPTGPNIVIPIGVWRVYYKTGIGARRAAAGSVFARCTLSTSSSSETDAEFTCADLGVGNTTAVDQSAFVEQQITLAAKTTYYLNAMTTAGSQTNLLLNSQGQTGYIRAVCALL